MSFGAPRAGCWARSEFVPVASLGALGVGVVRVCGLCGRGLPGWGARLGVTGGAKGLLDAAGAADSRGGSGFRGGAAGGWVDDRVLRGPRRVGGARGERGTAANPPGGAGGSQPFRSSRWCGGLRGKGPSLRGPCTATRAGWESQPRSARAAGAVGLGVPGGRCGPPLTPALFPPGGRGGGRWEGSCHGALGAEGPGVAGGRCGPPHPGPLPPRGGRGGGRVVATGRLVGRGLVLRAARGWRPSDVPTSSRPNVPTSSRPNVPTSSRPHVLTS